MPEPLKVLIVEDEALLAMELEDVIAEAGHTVVGCAASLAAACRLIDSEKADLALVDVHLSDGPTGIEVAEYIRRASPSPVVVFLTANPKRIPADFVGAVGVIAKPYTVNGLASALRYMEEGVRRPPPSCGLPVGFSLSPRYADEWA